MKTQLFGLTLLSATGLVCAETIVPETNEDVVTMRLETRFDYQRDWLDGKTVKDNSGFEGKFLNIRIDGNITDNLSYSFRHRLNRTIKDTNFWDATDWMTLYYNIGRWSFSGGKEIVAIGGYEYDLPPIDVYAYSVFCSNINCYEVGASVGFKIKPDDILTFQFCESPFYTQDNRNMYAYNLKWNGHHGIFDAIYSANLIEYAPGRYINYLALGNKFTVGNVSLTVDLMNRAASHQTFFFKDMSVGGELSWYPDSRWRIFGKMTYDVNKSGTDADMTVMNGTEMKLAGAGVEFYPFSNSRHILSFHADAFYYWGHNANAANSIQNKTMLASIGVKWYMNLLSLKRKK